MFSNIVPATSSTQLLIQYGTGGGPTWKSSGNYANSMTYVNDTLGGTVSEGNSGWEISVVGNLSNAANKGVSGRFLIGDCQSASAYKQATHQAWEFATGAGGANLHNIGGGVWNGDTNAVSALRLLMASGNILTGSASLYQIGT